MFGAHLTKKSGHRLHFFPLQSYPIHFDCQELIWGFPFSLRFYRFFYAMLSIKGIEHANSLFGEEARTALAD